MKIFSQIYEVQTPEEAVGMMELGVDHVGSVVLDENSFLENKKLFETVKKVKEFKRKSSVIPLFSNFDSIMKLIDFLEPDIIHLCESLIFKDDYTEKKTCEGFAELQYKIKSRNKSLRLMRSMPIIIDTAPKEEKDISIEKLKFYISSFEEVSDLFLTDTLIPEGDDKQPVPGFVGITGKTCDVEAASFLIEKTDVPVILAGGLGPDNVHDLIVRLKPYGVDSCTNTNFLDEDGKSVRFKKDPEKVEKFIKEIKRAEEKLQ